MKRFLRLFFLSVCPFIFLSHRAFSKKNTPNTSKEKKKLKLPKSLPKIDFIQTPPLDFIDQLIKKKQNSYKPYTPLVQQIDIHIDYFKLIKNLFVADQQWQANIGFLWRKNIYIHYKVGKSDRSFPEAYQNTKKYHVKGHYNTIGIGYYIKYDEKNNLYSYIGYGKSYYTDQGHFLIESQLGKGYAYTLPQSDPLALSWYVLAIGSETKIFSDFNFYAGWIFSLKMRQKMFPRKPIPIYHIPGYGLAKNPYNLGLQMYLSYKINFIIQEKF